MSVITHVCMSCVAKQTCVAMRQYVEVFMTNKAIIYLMAIYTSAVLVHEYQLLIAIAQVSG